jgi:hypothetical protein
MIRLGIVGTRGMRMVQYNQKEGIFRQLAAGRNHFRFHALVQWTTPMPTAVMKWMPFQR